MAKPKPTLIIFAGANGSGKTTAAEFLLPKLKIDTFVNADDMAKGLSRINPASQALAAGRLVLERTTKLVHDETSFSIETTLSGKTLEGIIRKARKKNYSIEMHYIFCSDVRINLARIRQRVKQGGHHVSAEDVRRRYKRSLGNFLYYENICDNVIVYDTTGDHLVEIARKVSLHAFEIYDEKLAARFFEKVTSA